jgi:isoquinoline 1-oxidoreductase beta subunit
MISGKKLARRAFLVGAGVVGGGLLVGAGALAARLRSIDDFRLPDTDGATGFGAWLTIAPGGDVTIMVPHQEMGQGIYALAVLLAAEGLKLPPEAIRAAPAPIAARYANPVMLLDGLPLDPDDKGPVHNATIWTFDKILRALGLQATGGSTSTRNIAEPIRACAAATLDLLTRAAAARFKVAPEQIKAVGGTLVAPDGRSASYGELAAEAGALPPREIALPPLAQGLYTGKGIPRPDVPPKAVGLARYGIDTRERGQLFAAIRHAPRIGGALARANLPADIPGVRGIVEGRDYVAVVAERFSTALAALDKTDIRWDEQAGLSLSTKDVFAAYRAALDKGEAHRPRWVIDAAGDKGRAAATDAKAVKATYQAPFLAHATMEPMNATALVTETRCDVWAGHQSPSLMQLFASRASGVPTESVVVHTPFLGGGFGRRVDLDYVTKAVEIAKRFKGVPVQTIWTRAEDMRDDVFRPAAMADVAAALDSGGLPTSFLYRIAVPSITDQFVGRILPAAKGGLMPDKTTVDGAVFPLYALPNRGIENVAVDMGVPVGFWRSVGYSLNCFFLESFIDELAAAAGIRPLDYRVRLLADATGDRSRRAKVLAERLARYDAGAPLAAGKAGIKTGRGFAVTEAFHSILGHAADVEISGTDIRVRKVFVAVDCGFAIDPPNVVAQVRSAVNYGLSAALFGAVDLDKGQVVPTNFDTYPVMTLDNAPDISVEIVNSGAEIGGVGEIGTPGIAPAVANAIFAATGQRLRSLPFALAGA